MWSRSLSLLAALVLSIPLAAQQAERPQPGPVFRLSVSLVQVDAVVTDRQGRHVRRSGPPTSACGRTASRSRSRRWPTCGWMTATWTKPAHQSPPDPPARGRRRVIGVSSTTHG